MALSIFSSEKRLVLSLLVLLIGALVIASINLVVYLYSPESAREEQKNVFFRSKITPARKYNVVLLGDSRCLTGFDPAILEKKLSLSVFNCSFSGGGLNSEIYDHVCKNVLKDSSQEVRAVVLCVTPLTMAASSRTNDSYHQIRKEMTNSDNFFQRYSEILFRKIRTKKIKSLFKEEEITEIYHDNGYLEKFARVREKAQRNGMQQYKLLFTQLTFPEINMKELVEQTRFWRAQNVTVFAFYPPSRQPMEQLETQESAWDLKGLIQAFEAAGGIYLEVANRDQYNAYDSIHLASDESKKLSTDLAEKIHFHLQKGKSAPADAKSK